MSTYNPLAFAQNTESFVNDHEIHQKTVDTGSGGGGDLWYPGNGDSLLHIVPFFNPVIGKLDFVSSYHAYSDFLDDEFILSDSRNFGLNDVLTDFRIKLYTTWKKVFGKATVSAFIKENKIFDKFYCRMPILLVEDSGDKGSGSFTRGPYENGKEYVSALTKDPHDALLRLTTDRHATKDGPIFMPLASFVLKYKVSPPLGNKQGRTHEVGIVSGASRQPLAKDAQGQPDQERIIELLNWADDQCVWARRYNIPYDEAKDLLGQAKQAVATGKPLPVIPKYGMSDELKEKVEQRIRLLESELVELQKHRSIPGGGQNNPQPPQQQSYQPPQQQPQQPAATGPQPTTNLGADGLRLCFDRGVYNPQNDVCGACDVVFKCGSGRKGQPVAVSPSQPQAQQQQQQEQPQQELMTDQQQQVEGTALLSAFNSATSMDQLKDVWQRFTLLSKGFSAEWVDRIVEQKDRVKEYLLVPAANITQIGQIDDYCTRMGWTKEVETQKRQTLFGRVVLNEKDASTYLDYLAEALRTKSYDPSETSGATGTNTGATDLPPLGFDNEKPVPSSEELDIPF